ncbi:Late embryogenesis abundant (LEA) hydroxyproline-rich glycoprotein family [Forsythia ovata]|uniref:Late embryogenesis abundant (LEA) hydroxyproline-rich glycoprotein family n=1 Tax=Forsythia ovata TaxID=205694 RepID=A0ABD1QSR5_9LAMI
MSQGHPPLQKPPGYRDPSIPIRRPQPQPLQRKAAALPPSFYQKKRRSYCRICCCCTCIVLFLLIILIIAAGAFFYLWMDPKLPVVHLKTIKFTKFKVTNTDAGPALDAQSSLNIEIKNPNTHFELEYDKTRVVLNAGNGANLGEQTLNGFTQGKNNVTTLKFTIKASRELMAKKDADMILKGFKNKNLVLSTEVRTGIGLKGNGWKTGTVQVNVICAGMKLNQIHNGAMPKCRVKLFDWVYVN